MPHIETLPYLTFSPSLVQTEAWHMDEAHHQTVLPEVLKEWDPLTDLKLSRAVDCDFPKMFSECNLSAGAELLVAASWYSAGTSLREMAAKFVANHTTPRQTVTFEFAVNGSKLAGRLTLLTRVLLRKRGKTVVPLAPSQVGCILWQDEQSVQLEGLGARFPIQFADFAELGLPTGAGWSLHWTKDFSAQFMGRVWLLINTRHERLRKIVSGSFPDPQAPAIFAAIHFDIARQLISGGLANDDFVDQADAFEQGSTGEAIRTLLRRVFGDQSAASVRDLFESDTEHFDCFLQDRLKLFYQSPTA